MMLCLYYFVDVELGILDFWFFIFVGVVLDNSLNFVLELFFWVFNFFVIVVINVNGELYLIVLLSKVLVGEDMFDKVVEQWRVDGMSFYCLCIKIDRIVYIGLVFVVLDLDLIFWIFESVLQ